MANTENTDSPETSEPSIPRERKTWQFGHFQTKHDGKKWRLVRTHTERGFKVYRDFKIVASNKSATPLVALARELSRVEKRDIRSRRIRNQIIDLNKALTAIDDEIAAEAVAISEVA
jgi:hypothetical protein